MTYPPPPPPAEEPTQQSGGYPQGAPGQPHGTPGYPHHAPGYPPTAQFPAYGPVPQDPEQGPRKGNGGLIAIIVISVLLLCGGTAVAGTLVASVFYDKARSAVGPRVSPPGEPEPPPAEPDPDPAEPGQRGDTATVVYEVTGDGPADITYIDQSGAKHVRGTGLPWRQDVKVARSSVVSVVAIRSGGSAGTLSCRATVDGAEVAQRSRASGSFAIVSCTRLIFR
jgi:Mycobacterium membrane protein